MKYQPIIGLEVHVELATKSKMFCGCKNDPFHAAKPNIFTCPVCLGLPGALPVPNRKAVEWTIMLGLALNCQIPELSKFDRKNYFYPDLPKGYQISQYDQPLCRNGWLENDLSVMPNLFRQPQEILNQVQDDRAGGKKRIHIQRVHLEEDTGKLLHAEVDGEKVTLIDFNRSGIPLVEIVTEPDIYSAEEAKVFLKKLHQIIRYLGISDADMEKGSMRLEPNISVKRKALSVKTENYEQVNEQLPPYKVEVKNINSFKFVGKAIEYEVKRQIELLDKGETPVQETRGWDEKRGVTLPQRRKEEAHDYRYFPEPDIPPMRWKIDYIEALRRKIPEMPDIKLTRFSKVYGLPVQDTERLTEEREMADFFEAVLKSQESSLDYKDVTSKMIANWMLNKNVDIRKVTQEELLKTIATAKTAVYVDKKVLNQIAIRVIAENSKAVVDYKSGKTGVIMFLVGQVIRELKGKGEPQTIRKILEKELE